MKKHGHWQILRDKNLAQHDAPARRLDGLVDRQVVQVVALEVLAARRPRADRPALALRLLPRRRPLPRVDGLEQPGEGRVAPGLGHVQPQRDALATGRLVAGVDDARGPRGADRGLPQAVVALLRRRGRVLGGERGLERRGARALRGSERVGRGGARAPGRAPVPRGARAAALKAALAAEDAATSAEKRDYGLRKASIGAAWPACVVHAGYETPGKGVSLRLDVPEAWRDAPLAKLLEAVDAWEMTKARKKAKRRRRPVRARSARCEDLEGYNLDHLSVYEAIEASAGCVVLR